MRTIFLLLVAISVWSSSCVDKPNDHSGTLEIIFKGKHNSQALVMYDTLSTSNTPEKIFFKKLEFFVSDIKGQNASGATDFIDVGYINLAALNQASAEAGHKLTITDIPVGSYTQLDMGVGISDAANNTTPGDYSSSHPLGQVGNYWPSWNSYILSKIEGRAIPSSGTSSDFLYHTGVNGMQQLRSFNKAFDIADGETTQLIIHMDAGNLFFAPGNEIDVINEPQTHSGASTSDAYALAKKSIENLANSLSIQ